MRKAAVDDGNGYFPNKCEKWYFLARDRNID